MARQDVMVVWQYLQTWSEIAWIWYFMQEYDQA